MPIFWMCWCSAIFVHCKSCVCASYWRTIWSWKIKYAFLKISSWSKFYYIEKFQLKIREFFICTVILLANTILNSIQLSSINIPVVKCRTRSCFALSYSWSSFRMRLNSWPLRITSSRLSSGSWVSSNLSVWWALQLSAMFMSTFLILRGLLLALSFSSLSRSNS